MKFSMFIQPPSPTPRSTIGVADPRTSPLPRTWIRMSFTWTSVADHGARSTRWRAVDERRCRGADRRRERRCMREVEQIEQVVGAAVALGQVVVRGEQSLDEGEDRGAVSYTHLTLPTSDLV